MTTLPEKLPDGILLALEDLEKAEASPDYHVNMGLWHSPAPLPGLPGGGDVCNVCLAGAVMAGTLELPPTAHVFNAEDIGAHFDRPTRYKLFAMDHLQAGRPVSALVDWCDALGLPYWDKRDRVRTVEVKFGRLYHRYRDDPAKFKRWARAVAGALAEVGL